MSLQLSDLITPKTADQVQDRLIGALQGIGFVDQIGTGSGTITVSGVPLGNYDVTINIFTPSEPGLVKFKYLLSSRDDGTQTQSGFIEINEDNAYTISAAGVTLLFLSGPDGAGTSYVNGDIYKFSIGRKIFYVDAWQPGSVPRTFLAIDSAALSDLDKVIAKIASSGFVRLARGPWLTLVAKYVYDLDRVQAGSTVGQVLLTNATASPVDIAAGDMVVTTADGKRYRNTVSGTVPGSGTLSLQVQAESPGAAYNVGNGTITLFVTAMPGLTVSNPAIGMTGTWITTQGIDDESDDDLAQRCEERWPSLAIAAPPEGVYDLWARKASTQVTRTRVSADGSGTVTIVIAGPAGHIGDAGVITAVGDYIAARAPLTATSVVQSANNLLVTITGTIYVKAAQLTAAQAAGETAVAAYFQGLPIGGDYVPGLPGGKTGIASREKIISALTDQAGVVDSVITAPASDTQMTATDVATYDLSGVSWVGV